MRVGIEALRLKWSEIDFDDSTIAVVQSKTGKRPNAFDCLDSRVSHVCPAEYKPPELIELPEVIQPSVSDGSPLQF